MDRLLEVRSLKKTIDYKVIFEDINFEIKQGEIVGFLGENGAGKTTVMRILLGLISMDSGDVFFNGKSLKTNKKYVLRNVQGIIEKPNIYEFMTGYENLMYLKKLNKQVTEAYLNEIIDALNLNKHIHKKVLSYSLGLKQRLGIAQALINSPRLLILDEPLNGLDPLSSINFKKLLKYLVNDKNISIFISSHILTNLEELCDRILFLNEGKLKELPNPSLTQNKTEYVYEVNNIKKAIEVLEKAHYQINVKNDVLYIIAEKAILPSINRLLFENELEIFKLYPNVKSLEEVYLDYIS